ncbi:MAG: hypothetical protein AAFR88_00035 [Pseudomonadota bacterium]
MRVTMLFPLPALAILAACAPAEGRPDLSGGPFAVPPAKVIGEPENCINRVQIRQARPRNDDVIDFEMRGGDVFRSTLRNSCPRLGFEQAITYNTSINQLCQTEIIYVLENIGGQVQRGAGCSLGPFVPIEYIPKGESETEDES